MNCLNPFVLPPQLEAFAAKYPGFQPARVISQQRGMYRILSADGEKDAQVSGKFRHEALTVSDFPTVGDYVMTDGQHTIHHVLNRRSVFLRKASGTGHNEQAVAANVDTVFVCMSLNLDYNPRRLERYLSAVYSGGATPVVVLTKADLCPEPEKMQLEAESIAIGTDVLLTSSLAEDGADALLPYLKPGKTVAFVGSSGVGKSSLINRLLGQDLLRTNGLRNDDKGRHTTTHREMFFLPGGAMLIDTPGMREIGMWDAAEGVNAAFEDIAELETQCRFSDCNHQSEPGCAVKKALESGQLEEARWRSYLQLKKEAAYAADSDAYLASKKQLFVQISKWSKTNVKKR